jgi:hypothetical protein
LFINYIPQSSNLNQLAAYNLSIADQKTAYVASVDEIWGVRFDPSLNKTVLTRLSLKNKINTDVSIFPADKLVRKIIGVDEILKKIYYLEGGENSITDDKTIIGPFGFTVTYNKGVINIDPANKKLYILSQYKIATESGEPRIILPEYIPTTILEINYNNLPPIWKNLTPEKNGLQAFNNLWESYPDGLKGFVFVKHGAAN